METRKITWNAAHHTSLQRVNAGYNEHAVMQSPGAEPDDESNDEEGNTVELIIEAATWLVLAMIFLF